MIIARRIALLLAAAVLPLLPCRCGRTTIRRYSSSRRRKLSRSKSARMVPARRRHGYIEVSNDTEIGDDIVSPPVGPPPIPFNGASPDEDISSPLAAVSVTSSPNGSAPTTVDGFRSRCLAATAAQALF